MALFFEFTPQCARRKLDTADIVREAIFRQFVPLLQVNQCRIEVCAAEEKSLENSEFPR
jgi:hypothetical protein